MKLTGKQLRHLRALSHKLKPMTAVGKAGISPELVANLKALLARHELVKVHLPAGPADERHAAGDELARVSDSVNVGVIGRSLLLYRPNPELPKPIRLPADAGEGSAD